ncbi:MAG TPA: DUF5916 domain-containing protein [Gemmatimonadales bacterium]|nr:DUF5916 domain-containing protein [Gemmatimonadales bacterium]
MSSPRLLFPIAAALLLVTRLHAQSQSLNPREVRAFPAGSGEIHMDGRLDEPVWAAAQPAGDFVQRDPDEGKAASQQTEVRFVITPDALVIGARMRSTDATRVRGMVGRRDNELPSEELLISLDTRGDRVTAYTFAIAPGGTRRDIFHPSDNLGSQDASWDPVWQAATSIDDDGWSAEIRIPLTQLRFDAGDDRTWGLNLVRKIPAHNELAFWVLVPRNQNGWSSRMGRLTGLGALRAPARLEVTPYFAAEASRLGTVDAADPFAKRTDGAFRTGADLKLGLSSSLTLDATINPDFGQVEADPAEVNLTVFETFFSERRPFFVEGSNLFGGRNTFYSRRIGARPAGSAGTPYSEEAGNSTILGAAKVTGRTPSGISLGLLTAVTAEESVRTFDPDAGFGQTVVAPLTGYAIATAQREIGRDRSTARASVTAVSRNLDPDSPLASLLAERAVTGLLDGRWRWAGGRYDVSAYLVGTLVEGSPEAMLAQQRSSRRYFQRPDADHLTLDPARTSLTGLTAGINHSKMAGNWLWDVDLDYISPGAELNDLGFQNRADLRSLSGNFRYRGTVPGGWYQDWGIGVEGVGNWNTVGTRLLGSTSVFGGVTWKNFWFSEFEVIRHHDAFDDRVTRGGPLMGVPGAWHALLETWTRPGATTQVGAELSALRDDADGWDAELELSFRFRPGSRWLLSFAPAISREVNHRQYVATRPGGPEATMGSRYLFGRIDRREISAQFRASVALTPELTLEGYFEPFASSGQYTGFGELVAPGTLDLRRYGTEGSTIDRADETWTVTDGNDSFTFDNPDFSIRSFRSNMVLRWEWRPGSTAYLVWQQNRFEERDPGSRVGTGSLFETLGAPGDNVVALKVSYWLSR